MRLNSKRIRFSIFTWQMLLNLFLSVALVWANLQFAHSETRICNSEIKNKEE